MWHRDDVNGVRQGRRQHSRRSVVWLVMAALYAAALGSVTAAVQSDEPPELPNLWISRGQLEDSPDEASVEHAFELERYKTLADSPRLVPHIIGGQPAEPDIFSWQVDLGNCGGTLIARDWVLTAAHCVGEGRPTSVRVGSYELGGGEEIEVSAIHIHPEYSEGSVHDIALLRLARAAPEALGVVALPDPATHNRLAAPGKTATAIGWGHTESDSRPTHLQQAGLLLEGCAEDYSYRVCTTTLLLTDFATNVCFGDSGGPLLGRDDGRYYQIGISSRVRGQVRAVIACFEGALFTKVVSYLDWISSVTGTAFVEPPPVPEDPMAVDICSRTAAVRDGILSITSVADCATVTDAVLAAIRRMDLSNAGLTDLQAGDFAGLSGLTFLDLRDNGLTQVPQSLFADLAALTELVLDRNRLEALPADVFDPLAALTRLDLADNSLMELPSGVFDNLSSLITLNISRNDIAALPSGVFDELGSLNELNLLGNPLAAVPEGIFADLTELKILTLGDKTGSLTLTGGVFDGLEGLLWLKMRGVESLTADVFARTPDLLLLEVSNGALTSLPAGVFDNLGRLTEINLLGNPLATVPEGNFADLIGLKILSLGDNTGSLRPTGGVFDGLEGLQWLRLLGVASLSADAFAGTPNLRILGVLDGALSSLPVGVFDNLSRLTDLELAGNPIATLPEGIFANLTELEKLYLGDSAELLSLTVDVYESRAQEAADDIVNHVPLTLTDGVFDGLEGLRWLMLRSVASLSAGAFTGTPNLVHLEVYEGTLSSLPAGVFDNLSSLTILDMYGNNIAALPSGIFDELGSLTYLDLSENAIAALPSGVFDELGSLTWLELANNPIVVVPEGLFANLTELKTLSLGYRMGSPTLTAGVFDGLDGLQWLVLYGMASLKVDLFARAPNLEQLEILEGALSSLPAGVFDNLSSLTNLDMYGNNIAVLPSGVFKGLTNLKSLKLTKNQLATLPAGVFEGLSNLQFLGLAENPGTPFILTPKLQPVGSGHQNGTVKLRVIVAEGAPFETGVSWTATGGVGGATTGRVSVPGGSLYSGPFSVTSADSRGQISIGLSDPTFLGRSNYSRQALGLAVGDPLMLDLAILPSIGEQFVLDEDISGMPTGDWAPDVLSRAEFSSVNGQVAVTFRHGGRMKEDGVTYTCMSSGSCAIEGTRVTKGIILVSEPSEQGDLIVSGVGELVDEKTVFQEQVFNGYELGDSTVTLRSVAGEMTRVSFLDPGGDLIFVDFSSDDPTTEVVITLEEFAGVLEDSPYDQPGTRYAQGLATVTVANPTELTWLKVVSLGNHIDRVDLALIKDSTFEGEVDGIADIQAVVIEDEGSLGAIDATNVNFVSSFGTIGIDAGGTTVKRALSIGDITPSEGVVTSLRIGGDSLDPGRAAEGETVIEGIWIAGGDLREATGQLQVDTGEVVYRFPIVAVDGERSIRNSALRPDLGDGVLPAVTDTFVANPDDYFVTDGQTTE